MPALRICIVDDAPVLRSLFARISAALGHTIVASESSAVAALERLREIAPDVLVIDGRIGAPGAVDFLGRARAELPAMRILIVASLEETALVATAAAAGATGIVRRPFSRTQIRDVLRGPVNGQATALPTHREDASRGAKPN